MERLEDKVAAFCEKGRPNRADVDRMQALLPGCSAEERQRVAEQLGAASPRNAWPLLRILSADEDPLVRAEACQSLGASRRREAVELLMLRAGWDPDELVRAYAVLSLGDMLPSLGRRARERAADRMETLRMAETEERVNLALCAALYRLRPAQSYLKLMLDALADPNYSIRCFALNRLSEVASDRNWSAIAAQIARLKRVEDTRAVCSAIARLEREWGWRGRPEKGRGSGSDG